jgi:very-short-patch-repair endonuclease
MRFSKDVLALNPDLSDPTTRRQTSGQEDCADRLLDEMRVHAKDLAPLFIRDYKFDRWKIDLAIPSALLAVEVNGGYSNARGGKHGTNKDHRKIRMLTRAGWRVFVFTANEVRTDPLEVIKEIKELLS